MKRRAFLNGVLASAAAGAFPLASGAARAATSVEQLPKLEGELNLYLGRGEGGLYEKVIAAIKERNPKFKLNIRRGPTAALTNAILAEAKAGLHRTDLFWAVDSGAIGMVTEAKLAAPLPASITDQVAENFQFSDWVPVTGRIRTLPFNTQNLSVERIPTNIMELPNSDFRIGWAPGYAAFQSFLTGMRILQGDQATTAWLKAMQKRAKSFAGELGVVMAAERGEVDLGLANHYYTLRLKAGNKEANLGLAFTNNDAGCLLNASGVVMLKESELATNFIRYLLTKEVQSYLAEEAYELPMVSGVQPPVGLPPISAIQPPAVDLSKLADLRPTIELMRSAGVL